MQIPDWIQDYFNSADCKNKNGVLDRAEVAYAKKNVSIFKYGGMQIEAGMRIEDMIQANRSYLRKYVVLGDKDYDSGRKILMFGRLLPTFFVGRDTAKDDRRSIEVLQGQYAVKTYSKKTPSLQTYNIQNCVAVTIYDKEKKRGFMAHIDTTEKADDLANILKKLNFNPAKCEARIIGGRSNLSEGNVEIIDNILRKNHFKIVEQDILGEKIRAIQMDLATGEVMDYKEECESVYKRGDVCKDEYTPRLGRNQYSD